MVDETPQANGGNGAGKPPELRAMEDVLLARALFMRQAGITFAGARDTYDILGYDRQITVKQYRDRYARGGIAARIIDAFPNACWRGEVELIEDEDPEKDTPFEQAWRDLDQRLQIQPKLQRVDKLSRLSSYAVLLIGAPGALNEELPHGGPDDLLYLTPFLGGGGPGASTRSVSADADCTIHAFDLDTNSRRFGLPLTYQLKRTDFSTPELQKPVHWSRIIHVAENVLDDEVYGMPALERVWNLIDDLEKVTGGGAEAFWLRANQGLHFDVDKDMELKGPNGASDLTTVLAALKEQSVAYKHQMDRWIRTKGVKVETLGSDVANFSNPADAILTQIAGACTVPKRILTGSEMGELASSQDRDNWKDQINGRQTGHLGPYVLRPLVDRFIEYGYLPAPQKDARAYEVRWPHIETMTEKDKTEGAKAWAQVNATYGDVVYTDAEIRDKWSGMAPLDDDQRAEIAERKAEKVKEAQEMMEATQPPAAEPAGAFPRAAEDAELLRVLEAAIVADNAEVVLKIVGIGGDARDLAYNADQPRDEAGKWVSGAPSELTSDLGMSAAFAHDRLGLAHDAIAPQAGVAKILRAEPSDPGVRQVDTTGSEWNKNHQEFARDRVGLAAKSMQRMEELEPGSATVATAHAGKAWAALNRGQVKKAVESIKASREALRARVPKEFRP